MNPYLLLIFFCLIVSLQAYSQSHISGRVQDSDGKLLSFTNVLLVNAKESMLVKGMLNPYLA